MERIIRHATGRDAKLVLDPYESARGEPRFEPAEDAERLLWYGHPVNLDGLFAFIPGLLRYAQTECPVELTVVTAPSAELASKVDSFNRACAPRMFVRLVEWSVAAVREALAATDTVILPQLPNATKLVKSTSRLVEALRSGRFVVAHPIPAYTQFGDWAWVSDDLLAGLHWARAHPGEVVERIAAAQGYIEANFAPARIADQWEQAIKST
jgi:hypothetical protein